jgi:hypothetical protein
MSLGESLDKPLDIFVFCKQIQLALFADLTLDLDLFANTVQCDSGISSASPKNL